MKTYLGFTKQREQIFFICFLKWCSLVILRFC